MTSFFHLPLNFFSFQTWKRDVKEQISLSESLEQTPTLPIPFLPDGEWVLVGSAQTLSPKRGTLAFFLCSHKPVARHIGNNSWNNRIGISTKVCPVFT